MKNENEKNKKEPNPFLEKFNANISSRFDKANKSLRDYNKKIDYGFNVIDKNQ